MNLVGTLYDKPTDSNKSYYSNNVEVNGSKLTDGFSSLLIGDLEYYANTLETLYSGDSNNTGYFFDYKDDGIHLVKAYDLPFDSPEEDDPDDDNTEGGGEPTEGSNCYITISCKGSGNYQKCDLMYYENGEYEGPYLNGVILNMTKGSACATYSPNNSPGGFYFYVSKKSTATSSCSVTFRARSSKDCVTTTYKTITFQ